MRTAFVLVAAIAVGCGGGQPQMGSGSTGPLADAGVTPVADAGTSSPDAGTVTAPPPDAGTVTAPPPDAGTVTPPPPDAGTPADGGVTATDDCEGLAPPPLTAPTATHLIESVRADCTAAVDGSGVLMLQGGDILDLSDTHTHFVSPDGTLRSHADGTLANFTGQLSGFEGTRFDSKISNASIDLWDANGNVVVSLPQQKSINNLVIDPLGGIEVQIEGSPVENHDEHLNLRWSSSSSLGSPAGLVVDRLGNTLLLFEDPHDPKTLDGIWIDHAGQASAPFQLMTNLEMPAHLGTAVLTRVGGGAFVGTDGGLQWQLDSMATKLEPGPAWLRNAGVVGLAGFYMVRDGKGYGLITGVPSGATCGQTIEVISPSGKSCGKTTFSGGAGQCEFVATRVGYDGTVVQRMAPPAGQCNGGVCNCQFQWWTGFLH